MKEPKEPEDVRREILRQLRRINSNIMWAAVFLLALLGVWFLVWLSR
ncbi:MAG: hypothetical protein JXR94_11575 [Candidatus Hydrogenedentes bacterium]|nr:hypothetical protein [Candidatus Hydrogenedentota bacterium]